MAALAAALLIGAAALALAQRPLPAENAEGFAALWMLPSDAREETVVVGVISNEHDPAAYRLRITVAENGGSQSYRVRLDPGEERTFEVEVPPRADGRRTHLTASLYKEEQPDHLYRRVTSWLPRQETFP